ncbi:hypothetical protein pb186bvf_008864 [Paramecium bursaria]
MIQITIYVFIGIIVEYFLFISTQHLGRKMSQTINSGQQYQQLMNKSHKNNRMRLMSTVTKEGIMEFRKYIQKPSSDLSFEQQKINELIQLSQNSLNQNLLFSNLQKPDRVTEKFRILSNQTEGDYLYRKISSFCKIITNDKKKKDENTLNSQSTEESNN